MKFKFPYWPLLVVPICLYYLGALLNVSVMAINHGQMPVQIAASLITADFSLDDSHSVMTAASHLKFLCDWINLGVGIASPGDMLIWLSQYIMQPCAVVWAALMIKDRNRK